MHAHHPGERDREGVREGREGGVASSSWPIYESPCGRGERL